VASASSSSVAPSIGWRLRVSAAVGLVATVFVMVLYARQAQDVVSDWDATWTGARALLQGKSPYAAIHVPPWPWHLNYPLPAVIVSLPFAAFPLALARGLFVGIGAAIFTFVVTRRHRWALYFVISGAMLWSWIPVQWPPLLIAAALTPGLSWLLVVKPTMGFALWAAYPRRTALLGGLAFLALCFLAWPDWVVEWRRAVSGTPHRPHLLRPGGFLMLLGLLRWRRPEGRLLAALCIVPQTTALYEALPLALLVNSRSQAATFATATMAAHLLYLLGPQGPWPVGAEYQWGVMLVLIYLPAIGVTLARPNTTPESDLP
jgi:hypothetical protein